MAEKPFFSFVIPTYNRESDLQFALYCILQQSFSNFEVIISDNCSTDNTKGIINKFKDNRIRYFRNKENIGVILNIKKAIQYAKGEYIFLHSDDDFILYENSLEEIYQEIIKYNPGYIRVNYICLTPNKKRIFDFRVNKSFAKDKYLPLLSNSKKVLEFILGSDASFVTGIIFKNNLPNDITIVNCEPMSWIKILLYVCKKYGAYLIENPHIVASWSQLRINKNGHYQQYSLINGKLESENYFDVVKKYLDKNSYDSFLHNQLMGIYVRMFPLIKLYIGNKKMLQLSFRLYFLDPNLIKTITFWVYFIFALIFPQICIKYIKTAYFNIYTRFSRVDNNLQIMNSFNKLKREYVCYIEANKN